MDDNRFFEEKEIIWMNKLYWSCPTCGTWGIFPLKRSIAPKYCHQCGQKIKFPVKEEINNG